MPPWFLAAMAECETLALDVRSDRERLWERLQRHIPRTTLRDALEDHLEEWLVRVGGMTRDEVVDVIDWLATSTMECVTTTLGEA